MHLNTGEEKTAWQRKPVPGSHYALNIVHYFTTLVVLVVPSV